MRILSHSLYQCIACSQKVNKNERMQLLTSFGEITLKKGEPLAVSPGGIKSKCLSSRTDM